MSTKAGKAEAVGQQLKKFMQSENVWDVELFKILVSMEITTEEDIASISSDSQFDEVVRKTRLAHATEIKESESLARLNKLLSNFEKIWRKKSGIKVTTIKETGDHSSSSRRDKEEEGSHAKHDLALKKGRELKKYMQTENVWDVDLFVELVEIGIIDESGIAGISQTQFDEVCRKTRVIRASDNNSVSHNANLEKLLMKFEKLWRKASGIKRTNITASQESEDKSDREDERSSAHRDDALKKGQDLKKFMQKENVWDVDLFVELVDIGVTESSSIASITQTQFDDVCRKTRVIRLSDNNSVSFNANLEKLLTKFEKIWRQASGIKRTNITNSDYKSDKEDESSDARRDDAMKKGQALKKYMQKENIWDVDLFIELVEVGVTDENAISDISQTQFDEVCRKTRVVRLAHNNDVAHNANLEKLLTKFEKLWRAASGIKITTIKPGSKAESSTKSHGDASPTDGTGAFKKWMQKENVFEKELFDELVKQGITKEEDLQSVTQTQFDEIVRKVRVEKLAELKDEIARARLDKKLVDFEKIWRKISGIKRTAQKH